MKAFCFAVLCCVCLCASAMKISQASRKEQELFVARKLANMTLDDKIGQMTQGESRYLTPQQVADMRLGSLLNGGGAAPSAGNKPENWADQYDTYQKAVMNAIGIPLIYGQDAVHGVNNVYGATVFPHNIGLGCMQDSKLMEDMGSVLADELLAAGMTWAFTPCIAVGRDDRWGRIYESFSENPNIVVNMTTPFITSLQKETVYGPRPIGCAKHFMADGGAEFGTGRAGYIIDRGDCSLDEDELRRIHLPGYKAAVAAGIGTVMASYSSWKGVQMHKHKHLLTDTLKGELGFDGFVISDYNAVWDLPGDKPQRVADCVNAGVDMMMVPNSAAEFISLLKQDVQNGLVPESRIDDAVTRILRIKTRFGLFDYPYSNRDALAHWGSDDHRMVARRMVQKSVVLLKNEDKVLPLPKKVRVLVAGEGGDDIGLQCGGWTISWQGQKGASTKGTTIFQGIKQVVEANGGSATFFKSGFFPLLKTFDVVVLVLSEDPYAEGKGDTKTMALRDSDIEVLKTVRQHLPKTPIVAITLTGRPVIITDYVNDWKGLVAAFLPGTEAGSGIADVLFGSVPFTGRLSMSWPKSVDQEPINYDDPKIDPLYPFGYHA